MNKKTKKIIQLQFKISEIVFINQKTFQISFKKINKNDQMF